MEVFYNETVYKADMFFENDILNLKIVQPEVLNGLNITVAPTEITVINNPLELKYDREKTEELFPITQIYDVLIQLNVLKPEFRDMNGKLVAQFDVNQSECCVMLDKQGEKISEVEYENLVFKFVV